ncbi:MAG: hypothetical protein ACTS5Y_10830, partial [Pollutimonas bauzanensis]
MKSPFFLPFVILLRVSAFIDLDCSNSIRYSRAGVFGPAAARRARPALDCGADSGSAIGLDFLVESAADGDAGFPAAGA